MNNLKIENVWDYPRPPVSEAHEGEVSIKINDTLIVQSKSVIRVIETSHPPSYYIPQYDINLNFLKKNKSTTFCEWKGTAKYLDIDFNGIHISKLAWYYPDPKESFSNIKNHISFYAHKALKCFVNGELVDKQDGEFYGGWITKNLRGPFKGGVGTFGW